jgi:DNA primase
MPAILNGSGDAESVKASVDLAVFYAAEITGLRGRGEEREGFCPFHDNTDTRAFGVNVRTGAYLCRNPECGKRGGDVIDFYRERHGCDFPTALAELAPLAGVALPNRAPAPPAAPRVIDAAIPAAFHDALLADPDRLTFLAERRGLTLETIRDYEIGHDGQRYTIPIRDEVGECVNIRRYDPNAANKMISYRSGFGAARLFPIREALLDREPVLIVEGEWDALLARQNGLNAVTCTGGAGTWREGWNALFRGRDVVICYDCDPAGREGARKILEALR